MNEEQIENLLVKIELGSELAGNQLYRLHIAARECVARLRRIIEEIENAAIEHITETRQDIDLGGERRWYVGTDKKVKSRDDNKVLEAVLDAAGGDISKLTTGPSGVLASSPWKHGAIRTLVGDLKFGELFSVTETKSLETGNPIRVLKVSDPMFKKGGVA